jgi:hypothetical protein
VNANPAPLTKLRQNDHNINAEAKEVCDTMVTQTELRLEDLCVRHTLLFALNHSFPLRMKNIF